MMLQRGLQNVTYDECNFKFHICPKEFLFEVNKPLNFNPSKALNSQDLPNIIKLNFAVSIISKDLMFKKKSIIGDNPFLYKIDEFEGLDIDSHFEFNFAEYLFKSIQKN